MTISDNKTGTVPDAGQDLSTVLSSVERIELLKLVTKITDLMRKRVSESFAAPNKSMKNFQQAGEVAENANASGEKVTEKKDGKKELIYRKMSTQKRSDLEQASLDFFDKWKKSVISRVDEAVKISNNFTEKQIESSLEKAKIQGVDGTLKSKDYADAALVELHPPTTTALCSLPLERRLLLLHAVLLLLLSLKNYTAPSRILLLNLASSLHLPLRVLVEDEVKVAQDLLEAVEHMSGSEETKKRSRENRFSKTWKVGLAGVAGAAIIGVTGGLAAPLVAGAIGTIMGSLGLGATAVAGLLGGLAESSIVVGSLFGAYGARMTSKAVKSYEKEVNDFTFLPLKGSKNKGRELGERRLRVTIGVSGWLTQKEDVIIPWHTLNQETEVFALRWELEALTELGISMESVVKSAVWKVAKKEIITRTIFSSLLNALWPIALLKISKVLDNPFSICMNRADKAGAILADAIINKTQGERPVTLIGYSLGARLISACLKSLAERRAFGYIENVVLMGTPISSKADTWRLMRSVVSGRLVNVYSTHDFILAFLYRTWGINYGVAGIQAINEVNGVENYDASQMVNGHLKYQHAIGSILKNIRWESIDEEEVAREEQTLALLEEKEENYGKEKTKIDQNIEVEKSEQIEKEIAQKMASTSIYN